MNRRERQPRAVTAFHTQGFRHQAIQQQPGQHCADGERHEQPAPVQPLQQQGAHQRPEQGRQQGDVGQQGHHAYGISLAESLVQGRVADSDHKTQANALQQAQQVEQADVLDPESRQARQAKERAADQQQRAPSIAVGQRADQPLQYHAPQQVKVEGMGNVLRAGVEVADHNRHGRHDRVAGQVGQ